MSQIQSLGAANGGGGANSFVTDSGTATPAAGIINIFADNLAGATVETTGSGNTVQLNTTDANFNTIIGKGAGAATISGRSNTSVGYNSMNIGIVSGSDNSAFGATALQRLTTGGENVAVGSTAMQFATTSDQSVAIGVNALFSASSSSNNVAVGFQALEQATTGNGSNVCVGWKSGQVITTGTRNCLIGFSAGSAYTTTESSNIILGNNVGSGGEFNIMRLGGGTGSGTGQQNATFISGINGVTSSNPLMVTINSATDQLGVLASGPAFFTWHVIIGASQTMVSNNGYISNYAGTLAYLLPATSAIGDIIEVTSIAAQPWSISLNAGQYIQCVNVETTPTTGSITSTAIGDSIRMVCTVTDTAWTVLSMVSTAGFNII